MAGDFPSAAQLARYGCGPIVFSETHDRLCDRHLLFDDVIDPVASEAYLLIGRSLANDLANLRLDPIVSRAVKAHDLDGLATLERTFSDHFSGNEPGAFGPIRAALLGAGDPYMHLADLSSYVQAHERVDALHADREARARKAILDVASSGEFSSEIWGVKRCPVEER